MTEPTNPSGSEFVRLGIEVDSMSPAEAAKNLDKMAGSLDKAADAADKNAASEEKSAKATDSSTNATKRKIKALSEEEIAAKELARQKKELENAEKALAAHGQKFQDYLKEQVATYNMTTEALWRHKASMLGVSAQAEPLIKAYEQLKANHDRNIGSAEKFAHSLDGISFSSSRARSELIVLAHEAIQGRFSRIPASMMVLAEYTNMSSLMFSALGVSVIGAGIAIAATAVEVIKGIAEFDHLEKQLTLTGNMAGLTRDTFMNLGEILTAGSVSGGIIHATEILGGLASTGLFTRDTLNEMGVAAMNYSHMTGESADKTVGFFAKMEGGVAKWAESTNKQYHFLTVKEYEHIDLLEKQGFKQDAMTEAAKRFAEHADDHSRKVGIIVESYRWWSKAIESVLEKMRHLGAGPSIKEELAEHARVAEQFQRRIQDALKKPDFTADDVMKSGRRDVQGWYAVMEAEHKKALEFDAKLRKENSKASLDAETAEVQAQALADTKALESEAKMLRTREEKRKDAIAEADSRAAGKNAGYIQAELAKQGISYLELTKEARELDAKTTKEQKLSGAERINNRDNEFKLQLELAKKYNIDLAITLDQRQKLEDAANEKYKDKKVTVGNDGRTQKLMTGLSEIDGDYDKVKRATDANAKLVEESRRAGTIESATYYSTLKNDRDQELAGLDDAYKRKIKLLNDYNARNAVDAEQTKKRVAEVTNWYEKEKDRINNLGSLLDLKQTDDEQKSLKAIMESIANVGNKEVESLQKRIDAQEVYNASIGRGKSARDEARKAAEEVGLAQNEADAKFIEGVLQDSSLSEGAVSAYQARLVWLEKVIAKQKELSTLLETAKVGNAQIEADKLMAKQLNEAVDSAKRFEKGMTSAFGNVGKSIGQMTVALAEFQKKQFEIDQMKDKSVNATGATEAEKQLALAKAQSDTLQNQIGTFGELANAAKGFFSEQSAGYKTMDGLSKVSHAIQMAMMLKEMSVLAIKAVMGQAQGDPYSAWARMAAMAAVMATLGFAVGGGFNSSGNQSMTKEAVQKTQGTGTVFGDTDAKSQSIMKSLKILQDNSDETMPVSLAMLQSLKNIEAAMSGLANLVFRTYGITSGNPMGFTPSSSKKLGGIWGSSTRTLEDSGLVMNAGATFGDLVSGAGFGQYATSKTTSSSFFGLVKKTSYDRETGALPGDLQMQLGLVFKGLQDVIGEAGAALGRDKGGIQNTLNQVYYPTENAVSLRDLKGQELTDALNAWISAAADSIARIALPGFDEFVKIGEGYLETVTRVSNATDSARQALERLNVRSVQYWEVTNKQGDIEAEIVKQSLVLNETMRTYTGAVREINNGNSFALVYEFIDTISGVGKVMQGLSGTADELIAAYKTLIGIQKIMVDVGLGQVNTAMLQGAGGTKALADSLAIYQDKFFSAEEKAAAMQRNVAADFTRLGLAVPHTRAEFKALVNALAGNADPVFQSLAGKVLDMAGSFDTAISATEALGQTIVETFEEIQQLMDDARIYNKANNDLVKGAGGKDSLTSALNVYNSKFFSKEEQMATQKNNLFKGFSALGMYIPESRYGFKQLVQSFNGRNDAASQERLGKLLALADPFDKWTTAMEEIQAETDRMAEEVKSKWTSLGDTIIDEINRIRGVVKSKSPADAQAAFAIATAKARSGDEEAAKSLPELSKALLDIAEANAQTAVDLNFARNATANSLEQTVKILSEKFGLKIPGFARGGDHLGGYRLVGEHGAELEATGPSRIFSSSQTRAILGGELKEEMRALRQEVSQLRAENADYQYKLVINTDKMQKVLVRNDTGHGMLTTDKP